MNIQIDKQALLEPLLQVAMAVPSRTTIPVLNGILIQVQSDGLHLTATNMSIRITKNISADKFETIIRGNLILPAKELCEIIRKLPNQIISIQADSQHRTTFATGKTIMKLIGMDAEEYPELHIRGDSPPIRFEGFSLRKLIGQVLYAAHDKEDRPILTGVLIEIFKEVVACTAADSHRIARVKQRIDLEKSANIHIVTPADVLTIACKVLHDGTPIDFRVTKGWAVWEQDQITLSTRLLDGTYPPVVGFLSNRPTTTALIYRDELYMAIDRAIITAEEDHLVVLGITPNGITLKSFGTTGNTEDEVGVIKFEGQPLELGMNAKYLIDALKQIDHELVELKHTESKRTTTLSAIDCDDHVHLVMPLRYREGAGNSA
jgi:DNA polymerase-3 subunit beta